MGEKETMTGEAGPDGGSRFTMPFTVSGGDAASVQYRESDFDFADREGRMKAGLDTAGGALAGGAMRQPGDPSRP